LGFIFPKLLNSLFSISRPSTGIKLDKYRPFVLSLRVQDTRPGYPQNLGPGKEIPDKLPPYSTG